MSYYKEKRIANLQINSIVAALKQSKREAKISAIILEITNKFAISEKSVIERIKLIAENDDEMVVDEDLIKWV